MRRSDVPHLYGRRDRIRRRCARDHREAVREAMRFLIEAEWIMGEAELQGVETTREQVRRAFEQRKRAAFATEREYRRYVRGGGFSERMVLLRVRIDILAARVTRRVTSRVKPTADPRERARRELRALERFIADFRARWRAQTRCAEGYVRLSRSAAGPSAYR